MASSPVDKSKKIVAKSKASMFVPETVATPEALAEESIATIAPYADAGTDAVEQSVDAAIIPAAALAPVAVAPLVNQSAEAVEEGTKIMEDTFNQTQDKTTEVLGDINARAKSAMEKAGTIAKDSVEFHKGNLEALVEAGKVAVKGSQTVAQNVADYGRRNVETTTSMFKQIAAIKSPTELFKLQGEYARSQFDGIVAEMSKSTEFGLKLAGEIFQPIQNRYAVVADEMKTRLAA